MFLGLVTVLSIVPAAARAQDALTRACDLAAASPYDSTRPADILGVKFDKIDPKVALPACEAALATAPENPRLLFQMGRIFQANKNDTQARTFYEKSAAHANAGAQNNLGLFYETGRGGLPKNDQEAARLFKLAANQGEVNAQTILGFFYETGRGGLPKNDKEAARLFKLAAGQGLALAQYSLGVFYETGRGGLPKSDREAVRLYKLAADQGNAVAMSRLGIFYATGRGGSPKYDQEAARLCKLAADQAPTSAGASQSEIDALRVHISKCWYPPPGVDANTKIRVVLRVSLALDGSLKEKPSVVEATPSPLTAALVDSILHALQLAQPFAMLKPEHYNQWKEIEFVFDPHLFMPGKQ